MVQRLCWWVRATGGEQALNQEPAKGVRRRGPAGLQAGNRDTIECPEQESLSGESKCCRTGEDAPGLRPHLFALRDGDSSLQ